VTCPCTEIWQVLPLCEGETESRYAYGLWVHSDCTQHVEHLRSMQELIKETRGDDV
jgi:hypothetical protein